MEAEVFVELPPENDVIIKIGGTTYRCNCGCNVFRQDRSYIHPIEIKYICNSCMCSFIGERK